LSTKQDKKAGIVPGFPQMIRLVARAIPAARARRIEPLPATLPEIAANFAV
jgi:hypothetical protein